jgi:lysophospholipase L1-like esterase
MRKVRWSDVAAIAVLVALVAGLGFALRPQHVPTVAVGPSTVDVVRPQPPAKTVASVLFISDAYAAGRGLAETFYGCRAAVRMNWLCNLSAEPGTGFVSGGPANRFALGNGEGQTTSFNERLPKLAGSYQPDVVVLDGGRNDDFVPKDAEFEVMAATIAEARRLWPAARLIFIRPRLLSQPTDDLGYDDDFIGRLLALPAAQDMVVVDPIIRFADTDTSGLLAKDGSHPNQDGEIALSEALLDSLSENGFPAST